jgi:hypothetical protein
VSDELDPLLLRAFARCEQPLPDAEFVARLRAQLRPRVSLAGIAQILPVTIGVALGGLVTGILAPLRLRYAGLVALAVALAALWSLVPAI